ncbi:Glycosyltransferase involved in cell wall bisynthesis [Pustulibacterium marinum]|uniref:Glycosyltransferase involved in cell wall bisynthesis n=1 Tax=Pustulibacterium marinum TaxID=1224947 RepID=A0A1I7IUY5_9FLAO|nr:glycosyltransferase family 2 protein [Pustulibacterium marinum]SFU76746.1 Glycosyltransferase involved in cell wall bisynthesis [Pustulibacterium marinum]
MSHNNFYISVIIPVYNEEENIPLLTEKINLALTGVSYQIIYVDDFSTDKTRETIKNLQDDHVHLIELKKNYGQSLALAAGIEYASGDFIVTMDGDLQNDPDDILKMVDTAESEDWDVVTGFRENRKDHFFKTIPSKIANFIIRKATNLNLKDQGCAIKVFTNETAKELRLYGEMHRFINLIAFLNGARIKEVSVNHYPRKFGQSKYGLERTFKVVNDLLLIIFKRKHLQKPMYLFGNIGLIFFSIGILINSYLLIVKFLGNDIGDRPLLLLGILLTIVGIQFFTMGILADLLMRTYFESQNKKPYKVRKVHTYNSLKGNQNIKSA